MGYLAPHAATGSLFFVDPTLALEDVGVAISTNETDRVQHWLKTGDLVKIEALHAAQWDDGRRSSSHSSCCPSCFADQSPAFGA